MTDSSSPTLYDFTEFICKLAVTLHDNAIRSNRFNIKLRATDTDCQYVNPRAWARTLLLWKCYFLDDSREEIVAAQQQHLITLGQAKVTDWKKDDWNEFEISLSDFIDSIAKAHQTIFTGGDIVFYSRFLAEFTMMYGIEQLIGHLTSDTIPMTYFQAESEIFYVNAESLSATLYCYLDDTDQTVSETFHDLIKEIIRTQEGGSLDDQHLYRTDITFLQLQSVLAKAHTSTFGVEE